MTARIALFATVAIRLLAPAVAALGGALLGQEGFGPGQRVLLDAYLRHGGGNPGYSCFVAGSSDARLRRSDARDVACRHSTNRPVAYSTSSSTACATALRLRPPSSPSRDYVT